MDKQEMRVEFKRVVALAVEILSPEEIADVYAEIIQDILVSQGKDETTSLTDSIQLKTEMINATESIFDDYRSSK